MIFIANFGKAVSQNGKHSLAYWQQGLTRLMPTKRLKKLSLGYIYAEVWTGKGIE